MNCRHIAFAAALISTASMMPPPATAGEPRAVIELFTSQGCSSCPAADKVLGELSRDPTLVTMSLPVDYWDYLGWKDTLALHGHSNRERAYADTRGDREVYTPQVVVNGIVHVLGSDKAAIEQAIAQTRRSAAPLTLPVTMTVADGKVSVNVPAADGVQHSAEVWLCPLTGKAAGCDRPRREQRPHDCLHQRGAPLGEARRLERQGGDFQRAGGRSSERQFFAARHRPRGRDRAKRRCRQARHDARRRDGRPALIKLVIPGRALARTRIGAKHDGMALDSGSARFARVPE